MTHFKNSCYNGQCEREIQSTWIRTAGVLYFQKTEEAERRTGNENSYFSRKRQKNDVRNDVHVQMYVYVLYVLRKRKMCARCFGLNFAFIDRA